MVLSAQAILKAKARKSAAQDRPGPAILDQAELKAIQNAPVRTGTDLRAVVKSWPKDWQSWWAERAAIIEFNGNLSREQAERAAYDNALEAMNR